MLNCRPRVEELYDGLKVDIDRINDILDDKKKPSMSHLSPHHGPTTKLPSLFQKNTSKDIGSIVTPKVSLRKADAKMNKLVFPSIAEETFDGLSPIKIINSIESSDKADRSELVIPTKRMSTFEFAKAQRLAETEKNLEFRRHQSQVAKDGSSLSLMKTTSLVDTSTEGIKNQLSLPFSLKNPNDRRKSMIDYNSQEDRNYFARLSFQFHLIFSKHQETIYNIKQNPDISKLEDSKRTVRRSSLLKVSRTKSVLKAQAGGELDQALVDKIRNKLLSQRHIYNSKSMKTEEAASVQHIIEHEAFQTDTGVKDMEYLSLGTSILLL